MCLASPDANEKCIKKYIIQLFVTTESTVLEKFKMI